MDGGRTMMEDGTFKPHLSGSQATLVFPKGTSCGRMGVTALRSMQLK